MTLWSQPSFASHRPARRPCPPPPARPICAGRASTAAVVTASLGRHAERTGLLIAAAVTPATFTRSLGARSVADQGIISGLVIGLTYATTVATQDALTALASVGAHGGPDQVRRRLAVVDLAAIPVGLAVSRALTVRDDESPPAQPCTSGGVAERCHGAGQPGLPGHGLGGEASGRAGWGRELGSSGYPLALPGGLLLAGCLEWQRRRNLPPEAPSDPEEVRASLPASLGIGLGVAAGLATLAFGEERLATARGGRHVPRRGERAGGMATRRSRRRALRPWAPSGGGCGTGRWCGSSRPRSRWTPCSRTRPAATGPSPVPAGSREEPDPWETLGREGRRHVISAARPEPLADRPPGSPTCPSPR